MKEETPITEETIEQKAERGLAIFERIRTLQRKAYIDGIKPEYIILSTSDVEDLVDYYLHKEHISPFDDSGRVKILGLEIIVNENKILRLNP